MRFPEPRFAMTSFGGYVVTEVDEFIDRVELATAADPPTISAQEVRSATFSQARRSGYAPSDVDRWLDLVVQGLGPSAGPESSDVPPAPALPPVVGPTASGQPPEISARTVGVVRQSRGLPRSVALALVALVVVAVVLTVYLVR